MRAVVSKEPVATSRLPGLLLTGSVLTLSAIASWASRSEAGVGPGCLLGWDPLFSCQTGCLSEEPDCGESRVVRLGRPWVVMLRRHPHFSLQLRTRLALGGPTVPVLVTFCWLSLPLTHISQSPATLPGKLLVPLMSVQQDMSPLLNRDSLMGREHTGKCVWVEEARV